MILAAFVITLLYKLQYSELVKLPNQLLILKLLAMPEFDTSHVKNIVLLGHAGSGKTTLAECMLYEAGLITRRGNIAERNTIGDYHELEQERGNSIFTKLLHTKWRGYKINILDTRVMMILSAKYFCTACSRHRCNAAQCSNGSGSRNRYHLGIHGEI